MSQIPLGNNSIRSKADQKNELDDPNAAPLEQNVKNLECDGVIYKVVKEDPKKAQINVSIESFFLKQILKFIIYCFSTAIFNLAVAQSPKQGNEAGARAGHQGQEEEVQG